MFFFFRGSHLQGLVFFFTKAQGAKDDEWFLSDLMRTVEMQLFTTDRVGFRINFKHFKDTKPDPSPVDWTFFRMTSLGIAGIWCFSIEERYFAYLGLNSAFYKGQIVDNYIGKNKIASDYGFDFFLGVEHKLNDTWAITNEI